MFLQQTIHKHDDSLHMRADSGVSWVLQGYSPVVCSRLLLPWVCCWWTDCDELDSSLTSPQAESVPYIYTDADS